MAEITEQWAVREARQNLAETMKNYDEIAKTHKHEPYFIIGYLKMSVQTALRDLNRFAEANPGFTNWR